MDINYILFSHGLFGTESKNSTSVSPISNFKSSYIGKDVLLTWTNPNDLNFSGVRIQRKTGSYPSSVTDGVTVFSGIATEFTDTGLTDGTYYYRAFTYDSQNNINDNESQKTSIDFVIPNIYTVIIDLNNSNPSTSVTYADDAIGMSASSSTWDSLFPFNQIKPVMFKDGKVNYYLNPNNFAQKQDGSVAIINGNDGDVMIQFPKVWTWIRKIGTKLYVSLSAKKVNENYKCYAHTTSGIEKEYVYIGSYEGSVVNNTLRSISSRAPNTNITLENYIQYAKNAGNNYRTLGYFQWTMIKILYLIKYKNLNSQTSVGAGISGYSNITGSLNQNGMTGVNSTNGSVKIFGLEHLWGSYYEIILGCLTDEYGQFHTSTEFTLDRAFYVPSGLSKLDIDNEMGLISDVHGTNELGFFASAYNGTTSTYFTDIGSANTDCIGLTTCGGFEATNWSGIFGYFTDDMTFLQILNARICHL